MNRRSVASAFVLWGVLASTRVHALEDYAAAIAIELDLDRKPDCKDD